MENLLVMVTVREVKAAYALQKDIKYMKLVVVYIPLNVVVFYQKRTWYFQ